MKDNEKSAHSAGNGGTVVVAWNELTGETPSDRQQALRRSFAGNKVIVMGNPPGSQLKLVMQALLRDGARMAAGVDAEGKTYIEVQAAVS